MPYPKAHWFMLALLPVTLLYLLYATLGQTALWSAAVAKIAAWSPVTVFAFGALLGAMACVLGWRHGTTIGRLAQA